MLTESGLGDGRATVAGPAIVAVVLLSRLRLVQRRHNCVPLLLLFGPSDHHLVLLLILLFVRGYHLAF